MRSKLTATLVFCSALVLFCSPSFGAMLKAGGIADNDPLWDADPAWGVMVVTLPSGFSGTVREVQTSTSYRIIATAPPGTLDAPGGTETFTGQYGAFVGEGRLQAIVHGSLRLVGGGAGVTAGTESIGVTSHASSFSNNQATTVGTVGAGLPIPLPFNGFEENEGDYTGSGTLTGILQWGGLPIGEEFVLPSSGEFVAAVPEPSTLLLLGIGLAWLIGFRTKSKADES